jgi:glycosyltransferase involved in cell wall biosynthesis
LEHGLSSQRCIVFAANSAWNILNFRMNIVRAVQGLGAAPVALVPPGEGVEALQNCGIRVKSVAMNPGGASPLEDVVLVARYLAALREIGPAAYLGFTAKPNIYGSIAASALGIPAINNITGLGTSFIHGGPLGRIVSLLYRVSLRSSHRVFFHNSDDLELFVERRLVTRDRSAVIPGSGVDLEKFYPAPVPYQGRGVTTFLFIGRLLWEKGVGEFVAAADSLKERFPQARFQLLGALDSSRRGVPSDQLDEWQANGHVEYLGDTGDVRPFIAASDCVVLPSYREGMPRVLLEAAAMGRPLIAADVPGCRQLVEEGVTGFLCAVRSGESLAAAMRKFIDLPTALRSSMGAEARSLVERRFGEAEVERAYLDALVPLLKRM